VIAEQENALSARVKNRTILLQFPYAALIIASSTLRMSEHGGQRLGLIRYLWHWRCTAWLEIRN
jgi:hypothetical protein